MQHIRNQASRALQIALSLLVLAIPVSFGKGGGVGYWLEGTVASVRIAGDRVELVLAGSLTLLQYSGGPSTRQAVLYECPRGISASLRQGDPFFAMSSDWRGGAIRYEGELARLAQTAMQRGSTIKIELEKQKIDFSVWQCPQVVAEAIRETDHYLK